MTKKEFLQKVQEKAGIENIKEAEHLTNSFIGSLEEVLIKGDEISFLGFGKFEVVDKAPRTGRNPQTGEEINIPAKKVAKFKPGKALVEKLN